MRGRELAHAQTNLIRLRMRSNSIFGIEREFDVLGGRAGEVCRGAGVHSAKLSCMRRPCPCPYTHAPAKLRVISEITS